ncbi:MAG: MFS transporter [Anaerolineales bacterium]|nr:MFS transporter [Anaerolineales bacterium]
MKNASQPIPHNWAARFFTVWGGQAFSLFGSALVQFALVWYLTKQTGSATILATATLVAMLPQILLGPFAGALVDRWNRRVIMMVADGGIALATIGLIYLFVSGQVQIWHIYVIMMIRSLGHAFHFPAMQASTSLMVPEKHLTRVSGANQTLNGAINIVAPPTGALLLEVFPMQGVLAIDIATALLAILPLAFIQIPQPIRTGEIGQEQAQGGFMQDVREGLRYVASWPGLLAILIMATVINFLLTPTGALMPLLITKHFGLGALEFGLMDSAWGFGVIIGGLILSAWGGFKRKVATSMMGIIGIGLGVAIVGLTPANLYGMAVAGMAFAGIMNPIANGPLFALIQSTVKPEMQGRVMSLVISAASAMSPLSLMVAGPVSDAIGIRTWFWFGGLLCLMMGFGAFFIPAIMNVENNRNGEAKSDEVRSLAVAAD